jgi:hypothetical protein
MISREQEVKPRAETDLENGNFCYFMLCDVMRCSSGYKYMQGFLQGAVMGMVMLIYQGVVNGFGAISSEAEF